MSSTDTVSSSTAEFALSPPSLSAPPLDHAVAPLHQGAKGNKTGMTMLMADDDSDDCLLAKEAWEEIETDHELRFVHDGQEVLDYIYKQGPYSKPPFLPHPAMILLDLNMPKKNGHEVLQTLKSDLSLRNIPIIVFTTSTNSEEILRVYAEGANAFLVKPTSFEGYLNTMKALNLFWLHMVALPAL